MKENVGGEELGKPKNHFVGSPTVLFFFINIENLGKIGDPFSQLDWKTYCKKNYFLLQ